jgi:hypothetical protein
LVALELEKLDLAAPISKNDELTLPYSFGRKFSLPGLIGLAARVSLVFETNCR